MKVTVFTPGYGEHLTETQNSVINQKFNDFEYFITQKTTVEDSRISIVDSVNSALAVGQGEYFAVLGCGDIWHTDYLEKVISYLDANPVYGAAISHAYTINDNGEPEPHSMEEFMASSNQSQEDWLRELYKGNKFRGSVVFRRSAMDGEFDCGNLKGYARLEMIIRLLKKHPIYVIQEKLEAIRIREPESIENFVHDMGVIQRRHYRKYNAQNVTERKLMIATPFYELKGFSPYITSLLLMQEFLIKSGISYQWMPIEGDSYIDRARNTLCQRFLESDCTHLLLIDSDEQWNPDPIGVMLDCDMDVIGGAYPQKNRWDLWSSIPLLKDGVVQALPHDKHLLVKASVVSAGFMLIHRRALEKFENYYHDYCYADLSADHDNPHRIYISFFECCRDKGQRRGEDYTFSVRWRDMGGELWIYPDIDFGHFGIKGWYGNYKESLLSKK